MDGIVPKRPFLKNLLPRRAGAGTERFVVLIVVFVAGVLCGGAGVSAACLLRKGSAKIRAEEVRGEGRPRKEEPPAGGELCRRGRPSEEAPRHAPVFRVCGSRRSVMTQSQATYLWWQNQPRFQPLGDRAHGAWAMEGLSPNGR